MNLVTAVLSGEVDKDIFMEVPDEVQCTGWNRTVCKLSELPYDLKQAPRRCYLKIDECLKGIGFGASPGDPCSYV